MKNEEEHTNWQRDEHRKLIVDRNMLADDICLALISDLKDRSGLGNEYDAIDKETKAELQDTWKRIIATHLER